MYTYGFRFAFKFVEIETILSRPKLLERRKLYIESYTVLGSMQ